MTSLKLGWVGLIFFGLASVSVSAQQNEQAVTSSVKAAYPDWGFMVLDAGERHGLVKGSKLEVFRNKKLIGKVMVTELEPNQAVGDVVPGSVSPGVVLQKGDLVVGPDLKEPGPEVAQPKPPVQPVVVDGAQKKALKMIAINLEFGFVILNGGKDHGITPNMKFQIVRDGKRIGMLRINSVEPKVTVTDIIPGSVAKGVEVQETDEVWVMEGE